MTFGKGQLQPNRKRTALKRPNKYDRNKDIRVKGQQEVEVDELLELGEPRDDASKETDEDDDNDDDNDCRRMSYGSVMKKVCMFGMFISYRYYTFV
jgi:hypothetical protein